MRYHLYSEDGQTIIAGEAISRNVAIEVLAIFLFQALPHYIKVKLVRTPNGFDVYRIKYKGKKRQTFTFHLLYKAEIQPPD